MPRGKSRGKPYEGKYTTKGVWKRSKKTRKLYWAPKQKRTRRRSR